MFGVKEWIELMKLEPSVCLMCQFKDPEPYFAAFHAHHERLVDQIIYIDHGSQLEFSKLELAKTNFIACDIRNFVKDIIYAKVINQSKLLAGIDFLFILDIDEFLPFETQTTLHTFLGSYVKYGTGTLNWANGYPDQLKRLELSPKLWVQERTSRTKKIFYNLNKLKIFFPKEGNHNADYPLLGQTFLQLRPRRNKTIAPLIHLPIISNDQMSQKLNQFPKQDFGNKLQYLCESGRVPESSREVAGLVSDYREQSPRGHMFTEAHILKDLQNRMASLTKLVAKLPQRKALLKSLNDHEVKQLRTKGPLRFKRLAEIIALREVGGCTRMQRNEA